jgi:hypothetical protein
MDSFFATVSENIPLIFLDVPFLVGAFSSFLTGVAVTSIIIFSRQNREPKKKKPAPQPETDLLPDRTIEDYTLSLGKWDADYDCRNQHPVWHRDPVSRRSGSPITGPLTETRTKLIPFSTPILDTDHIEVQLKVKGVKGGWVTSGCTFFNGQGYGTLVDTLDEENKKNKIVRVNFFKNNFDLETKRIVSWTDGWWRVVKKAKPALPEKREYDISPDIQEELLATHREALSKKQKDGELKDVTSSAPLTKEPKKTEPLELTLRQSLMFWNYTWSESDPLVEVTLDEAIDDFKTALEFYKSVMVCTQTISRPTVAKWFKEMELYSRRLDENGKIKTFVQIKQFVSAGPEIDAFPFVMHWPFF